MMEMKRSIAGLAKQVTQLSTDVTELKVEKENLLSQIVSNPKGGMNVVTLWSGRIQEGPKTDAKNKNSHSVPEDHADSVDLQHAESTEFIKN